MMIEDLMKEKENVSLRHGVRYPADGGEEDCEDLLLHEHFLSIEVNGYPAAELCCTADHIKELVLGRLYTGGVIERLTDVLRIFICAKGEIAEVTLREGSALYRYGGREPSCCMGNRQFLAGDSDRKYTKLQHKKADRDAVFELAEYFRKDSVLHRKTSGTHSAYLRSPEGAISGFEDLSRHNALDKAVGHMLLEGYDPAGCMLYTTGRVPADMVEKVIMSRVPILLSKSVPTDAALKLAEEYGLTLLCKTWPDSYLIYAESED